jgi:hypothetical protein
LGTGQTGLIWLRIGSVLGMNIAMNLSSLKAENFFISYLLSAYEERFCLELYLTGRHKSGNVKLYKMYLNISHIRDSTDYQ